MNPFNRILREEEAGGDGGTGGGGGASLVADLPAGGAHGSGDGGGMAASWFNGFYNDQGEINPEAWTRVPDHLKDAVPTLQRYKTIEDLVSSHWEQKRALSKGGLARPADDAPESVKQDFARKRAELNGAPDTPEGYDLKKPENLPDGVFFPDDVLPEYASIFHKYGADPAMVNELMTLHIDRVVNGAGEALSNQIAANREQQLGLLRQEHGQNTPQVLQKAKDALMTLGLSEDSAKNLLTSAEVANAFGVKFHQLIAPDQLIRTGAEPGVGPGGRTHSELAKEAGKKAEEARVKGDRDAMIRFTNEEAHHIQMAQARGESV